MRKNEEDYAAGLSEENWKGVIRSLPLGGLTPYFTAQIIADKKVAFNASASSPGHGPILNYSWTLGDGTSSSGEYIEHQYQTEGTFLVTLKISNYALEESAATYVNVQNYPPLPVPPGDGDPGRGSSERDSGEPSSSQCSDGIDNDLDNLIDYPQDPGCDSLTDNDEINYQQPAGPKENNNETSENDNQEIINLLPNINLARIFTYGLLGAIIIISIIVMIHLRKSLFHLEKKEKEVMQLARQSFR